MNTRKLTTACCEATRFLELARNLLQTMKNEGRDQLICGNKLSGAVRRQSMELTRALAEMRKP